MWGSGHTAAFGRRACGQFALVLASLGYSNLDSVSAHVAF